MDQRITIRSAAFIAATITACITVAQPYWTRAVAGLGNDHISDVKVDEAGDIYVTGEFTGTAEFADGSHTAMGGLDFFAAKLNEAGDVLWWKQGGGYGLDRGIKLAFGPGNTLAVVGEFMGEATFQGVPITSQNNTADMFVAVLDRSTGAQQWIRHGGGAQGGDRPYGVTVSNAGQVTVAGEFRGTATWDGSTLISIPEPETLVPSVDVVIISYAANGTQSWIQQGAADHTDRAIDVVNDAAGNIYVAGQFSDTITFDVEHLNAMFNATFVLKLDAGGQEQWFRRCGGATYDHVRDMLFTPDGQLLIAGDLQGTMIFLDDAPDPVMGEDPYNYYLLRVDTDGQLVSHSTLGSSNGVSSRGIDLRNDTIAVLGQFNCQFTSLSAHYGASGLFMAAGGEDLFVNKHRYSDLGFIEARHYGGPGEKLAGQVATLPDGDVLVSGSYTRQICFATDWANEIDIDIFQPYDEWEYADGPWVGSCPLLEEHTYAGQDARGLKDGLLARAYVEDSVTYDWWNRLGPDCEQIAIWSMCAETENYDTLCADTVIACGVAHVHATLPFVPTLRWTASIGPLVDVLWSNGDTTLFTNITITGSYNVQVTAVNGCWSWSDTVYVIVHPMPPDPLISDDQGFFSDDPVAGYAYICDPDSITLWCTNIDPNTTWYWSNWSSDTLPPDTFFTAAVVVDTSGYWWFTMTTDEGCTMQSYVDINDALHVDMQDLDVEVEWHFEQDTLGTDSIWLCDNSTLFYQVAASWTANGLPTTFPDGLYVYTSLNGGYPYTQYNPSLWYGSTTDYVDGWNTLVLEAFVVDPPCGDDTLYFTFTEDIWIGIWPVIPVNVNITGDVSMCVGDSVLLTATCANCTGFQWNGGNVYGDSTASVWATMEGNYSVYGYVTDPYGCSWTDADQHQIEYPPGPLLLVDPGDGIICPFDSALIYTLTPGTQQVWYGPFGPIPNGSQQLWSGIPGDYYLTMVDLEGCEVTSDPVLLTGYGTPYLTVSPDNVLCLVDDEVVIQVVTTVPSSIVWAPPLSGSSLEQTVTQPGTYSVTATACGITTQMSVTVIPSDVEANVVDPGPFTICEGDSVTLEAVPGQALYIWQPGDIYASSITVTQPGEYVLQALDPNGCTDESDPVVVSFYAFPEPLITMGDTICPGEQASLWAVGSGTIQWYSDAAGQNPVLTGSLLVVDGLMDDSTFYVGQSDAQCVSLLTAVTVHVAQVDPQMLFTGPTEVCSGTSITLTAFANGATQYAWTTPTGTAFGPEITLDPVTEIDAGLYICTASAANCGSTTDSLMLTVTLTAPMDLGDDQALCSGDTASFSLTGSFTGITWNGVPGSDTFTTTDEGWVIAQAMDAGGCTAVDSAYVDVLLITQPLFVGDVAVCAGEDAYFYASGSGIILWSFEVDMDPVISTGPVYTWVQPSMDGDIYAMQTENGCEGGVVVAHLTVLPVPTGVTIDAPEFVCENDTLVITLDGPMGMQVYWNTPTGDAWGTPLLVYDFAASDEGTYTAYPFMGDCQGDELSATVSFQPLTPFSLGPDTTFCIGGTVTLEVPGTHYDPYWSNGAEGMSIVVSIDGTYTAYATDDNGCLSQDEVAVTGIECDPVIPNIITPNGDGVHDSWMLDPEEAGFTSAEMTVFDRHGNEVFHADPSRKAFAGENDLGEPLSEGVYYYAMRIVKLDGTFTEHKGYMHVNR